MSEAGKKLTIRQKLKAFAGRAGEVALGPILLKEVRGTFRTRRFFLTQMLPMVVIGALVIIVFILGAADPDASSQPDKIGKLIYATFFVAQTIVLLLVIPAFCCTTITEERERKTFDLLITSNLKPWEVVWGKAQATMAYVITFLLASAPLVFVSFLFGGVSPAMLVVCYVAQLLLSVILTVFSIFCSSLVRTSKVATVLAYLAVFMGGGFVVVGEVGLVVALLEGDWAGLVDTIAGIGTFNELLGVYLVPLFIVASICAFMFILTVNRIRPATGNRSTPMRIFTTVFMLGITAAYSAALWANRSAMADTEDLLTLQLVFCIPVYLLLFFSTVAFSCESVERSSRLRLKLQKLKGILYPLRLFGVGAISGAVFNLLLCAVVLAVPTVVAWFIIEGDPSLDRAGFSSMAIIQVGIWVFLYFSTMLGLFLSSMKIRPVASRCMIFFLAIMLTFGPFFHSVYLDFRKLENRATVLSGHYLSPMLSAQAAHREEMSKHDDYMLHFTHDGPGLVPLWVVHLGLYAGLATILGGVNVFCAPRRRRQYESDGAPGGSS